MADNPRIEDLRRRVQKDPASIAFAQLAEEYRRARQFQESVDACRAGLAIHPGYLSARVTLGRALLELGQLDEAEGELERVLASAPENLAAIRGLAEIHQRQGDLDAALTQYRAALTLARNDPDLQETVNDLARRVEPEKGRQSGNGLSFAEIRTELLSRPKPALPEGRPNPELQDGRMAGWQNGKAELPGRWKSEGGPNPAILPSTNPAIPLSSNPQILTSSNVPASSRAERTVEALSQWLDAIHAARAEQQP